MPRDDISKYLVHWTKGASYEEAFNVLRSIVFEQRLLGSNGDIKGGFLCVCFTEAPEDKFHQVLNRYKPFGIRVSKEWAFLHGGRPVIYQPNEEYQLLPDQLKWRHMKYELGGESPVDFCWEREWRIQTEELYLPPEEVVIILPSSEWADILEGEHRSNEEERIFMEEVTYGEWAAYQSPEPFHYSYSTINV